MEKRKSVHNEEQKFFGQIGSRSRNIAQTFAPCIDTFYHVDNLHYLHRIVIAHARDVLFCRPRRLQSQERRHRIFIGSLGSIEGNHQILEIIEEQRHDCIQRTSLGIIVKIIHNLVGLENVLGDHRIFQFEDVEIFADANLFLHHFRSNLPVVLGKRDEYLVYL